MTDAVVTLKRERDGTCRKAAPGSMTMRSRISRRGRRTAAWSGSAARTAGRWARAF